jgi:glycosyltransferase involved in cell wall biosynthesis
MPAVSVILCTRNPRRDVFARTLQGLREQTLPTSEWELVIVDNASSPALAPELDLAWHAGARVVEESEQGANPARQRGLRESSGALIVLVDDDNFLSPDYLAQAVEIAKRWPVLGAWGGSNIGEFEVAPPDWLTPYVGILAVRVVTQPLWTNVEGDLTALPFGAGMCLRRSVAERYLGDVAANPLKRVLGRRDNYDVSGEDPDIALTSFDLDLGIGLFPELSLRHYLPAGRLAPEAILRVVRGNSGAVVVLEHLRGRLNSSRFRGVRRLREILRALRERGFYRRIQLARLQGEMAAFRALNGLRDGQLRTPEDFRAAFMDYLRRSFI